jgi:hypothetical protein
VPRYFHDAAAETVYRHGDPAVTADRPRSKVKGWLVAMSIEWMSASTGPDAKVVEHWYDARNDSKDRALAIFSLVKRTPGVEVDHDEYRRWRKEYGERFAARSKR